MKLIGNIVETTMIGNATVHVCDDFIAKTPEEIAAVEAAFEAAGWMLWDSLSHEDKIAANAEADARRIARG